MSRASFEVIRLKYISRLHNDDVELSEYFDVIKTEKPKQEVAYGLVCDAFVETDSNNAPKIRRVRSQNKVDDSIVAGEKFTVKSGTNEDTDIITQQNIIDIVQVDNKCPVFHKFLEEFNYQIKDLGFEEIKISQKDNINICSLVNQILVDKAKVAAKDKEKVELEPLFIIMLKTVLDYLSKK